MKYMKLGRSNMTVSKICLGTMHFGSRATDDIFNINNGRPLQKGESPEAYSW